MEACGQPRTHSLWATGGQETDHMEGRSFMQDDLEKMVENFVLTRDVSLRNTVP